jgi:DUF1680 family protein
MEWLSINNLVEIKSEFSSNGYLSKYKITKKGIEEVHNIIQNKEFENIDNIIKDTLKIYHKYAIPKLLEYVHKEYDDYNLKSHHKINQMIIRKLDNFIKKEI